MGVGGKITLLEQNRRKRRWRRRRERDEAADGQREVQERFKRCFLV